MQYVLYETAFKRQMWGLVKFCKNLRDKVCDPHETVRANLHVHHRPFVKYAFVPEKTYFISRFTQKPTKSYSIRAYWDFEIATL